MNGYHEEILRKPLNIMPNCTEAVVDNAEVILGFDSPRSIMTAVNAIYPFFSLGNGVLLAKVLSRDLLPCYCLKFCNIKGAGKGNR